MTQYSKVTLGRVVHGLREQKGMTQEELGREAGYRTGAGVSISRLESGLLRPGPERFAGVAKALGLTPEELEAQALTPTVDDAAARRTVETDAAARQAKAPPGQKELNARKERIEHEIGERTKAVTELSEAFNTQHDRADEVFYQRFVKIAERVQGASPPETAQLPHDVTEADAEPADRLRSQSSGGVTGTAVGAARGAPGTAVGTAVLVGIVALPVVGVFAGGLAWMRKRNRTQRQEFSAQLDNAEGELAASGPAIAALGDILTRAAATLDYIATHGGHALDRWETQLGPGPVSFDALGPAEQQRYHDFTEIARAQEMIVTFDFAGILTTRGRYQDDLIERAYDVLTGSDEAVKARV